jgi:hypothetical protein
MRAAIAKLKQLVKKHGVGMVLGAATLDGYRRQYMNDKTNNELEQIEIERNKLGA